MKKFSLIFLLLIVIGMASGVQAQQRFIAALSGNQEVPANTSQGSGRCQIVLNAAETQITVTCDFFGLGSSANAAHIHGNGAVGVNAPILFGFTGVPSATNGSIGPLNFGVTPAQVADMRAHRHYANIHSTNLPGGEIRGQIKQVQTVFDDDGDGRTDVAIFRPATSQFFILNSLNGTVTRYSGGGGIFLTGLWDFSGTGTASKVFFNLDAFNAITWTLFLPNPGGLPGGILVNRKWGNFDFNDALAPADYDGDGDEDIAVFRRSNGEWWITSDFLNQGSYVVEKWGTTNDQSCVGDFDGDGKADLCAARAESGQRVWYIRNSSTGQMRREVFGNSTDAVQSYGPIDIDGDGKQDIMTIRQVTGDRVFHILKSSDGQATQFQWGLSTDALLFGDYDGDGKTDFVARRNVGGQLIWYILRSSDGQIQYLYWGITGDQ